MDVFQERPADIDLYTKSDSRNGAKVIILLEELGLGHRVHQVDIGPDKESETKKLLAIDPEGHVPTLTDVHVDGSKITLVESGSILQYLINRYDPEHRFSYPKGSPQDIKVNNWLFFQTSRVGPSQGEALHFAQEAPEEIPYGVERFKNQTLRLYVTLDRHLAKAGTEFIVGNKCTIADIALIPWVASAKSVRIDIEQFPSLTSWYNRMWLRPAVRKGMSLLTSLPVLEQE